ncbi:MAG: S41 family peptidase, partial [Chlorobiales bacterium]|nr:S41 family peptidase [Chlorobiales bacterium]
MKPDLMCGMSRKMIPVLVALLVVTGAALKPSEGKESDYFSIARNIELLGDVYQRASESYVDSLDTAEF